MDNELSNYAEAARKLRMSVAWLRGQVAKGKVPHHKFGKRVYFTQGDIDAIIEGSAFVPAPLPPYTLMTSQEERRQAKRSLEGRR